MISELETERLRLRQFSPDDFDEFAAFHKTENKNVSIVSGGEAWDRLAIYIGHWQLRGFGLFALEEKSSQAFIGWCGPWYPQYYEMPEIAWTLFPQARGKGYATEAAIEVRKHIYSDLGWDNVVSFIADDNVASKKVAQRLEAEWFMDFHMLGKQWGVYRHPSADQVLN